MTLLIHPGFHKTGTTWLQAVVFAEESLFQRVLDDAEVDRALLAPHDLEFAAEPARVTIRARLSGMDEGIVGVISHEDLSGNLFTGSRDSLVLADRLKSVCGEAKILLTVRNQPALTRSLYMQYVKRGGRQSLANFLQYQPEPSYFWFTPELLDYHAIAHAYGERFGHGNVLVLPQEALARDRQSFVAALLGFVGIDPRTHQPDFSRVEKAGVSPPASGVPILRLANLFRPSPLNPEAIRSLGLLGKALHALAYRASIGAARAEARMIALIKAQLAGRFGDSNARLQAYCPFDLSSLGYELPGSDT